MKIPAERDIAPDVLRGFALLGILLVNIPFMALLSEEGLRGQYVEGIANNVATVIIYGLFAGKFYILFSYLFGYSANYIVKGEKANRRRWIKRAFVLLFLGVIHFSLFWHGDILFLYGLFALLLIPFIFRKDRTIKIWAIIIYSVSTLILITTAISSVIAEYLSDEDLKLSSGSSNFDSIMQNGNYLEAIGPRIELWTLGIVGGILLQGGFVFAAFLAGLRAGRNKVLQRSTHELKTSRAIKVGIFIGLPIELTAAAVAVINENSTQTSDAIYLACLITIFVVAPLLTRMYVAGILQVLERKPRYVSWIRPAGRMSLTLYISQSILTTLVFGPWGLGLFQKVEAWMLIFISLAIWLFLTQCAKLWLNKYRQGPLEWFMHKLTA